MNWDSSDHPSALQLMLVRSAEAEGITESWESATFILPDGRLIRSSGERHLVQAARIIARPHLQGRAVLRFLLEKGRLVRLLLGHDFSTIEVWGPMTRAQVRTVVYNIRERDHFLIVELPRGLGVEGLMYSSHDVTASKLYRDVAKVFQSAKSLEGLSNFPAHLSPLTILLATRSAHLRRRSAS